MLEKFDGGGGLFDYSVSPGPVFWEFDTDPFNLKVRKVCWWWGGLFVYSVSPGPVFWEFDSEPFNIINWTWIIIVKLQVRSSVQVQVQSKVQVKV